MFPWSAKRNPRHALFGRNSNNSAQTSNVSPNPAPVATESPELGSGIYVIDKTGEGRIGPTCMVFIDGRLFTYGPEENDLPYVPGRKITDYLFAGPEEAKTYRANHRIDGIMRQIESMIKARKILQKKHWFDAIYSSQNLDLWNMQGYAHACTCRS